MATFASDDGSFDASVAMDVDRNGDAIGERMMTMDELKQEMFKSLKDTGTIEAIRAQLRRRFIEKLKQHNRNVTSDPDSGDNNNEGERVWSVDEQLVHGLIHEYLHRHGMEHTMAVFVPEVGGPQQLLPRDAIVQMLRLSPETSSGGGNQSAMDPPLVTLLLKELQRRVSVTVMSSATQTVMDLHDHRLALENELRRVETTYLTECASRKTDPWAKSFEERVLRYQREYDEMCEKRIKEDMERFKVTELGLMRVEERKKFERELDTLKTSMFQEHRDRLQRLQDRERELEMDFAAKKAELETSLFEARQRVFQDIEKLRVKHQDAEAKYHSETRELAIEAKRLQLLEDNLKIREGNLHAAVDGTVREKENALRLEKIKWESDTKAREEQLLAREHDLDEGLKRFAKEKDSVNDLRKTVLTLEAQLDTIQNELAMSERKLDKLNAEKRALANEVEAREQLLSEDKHSMKNLSYENVRLTAELKIGQTERSKLDDLVVERSSQLKQLEGELKELQHQLIAIKLNEATAIAEERKKLTNTLEAEREDARWKENELVGRLRDLQSRLAESEAAAEKYQTQYEDERVHVETLRHEVSSLHALLAQSQTAATMRHQGSGRVASSGRNLGSESANDSTERMLMRMMEMISHVTSMQGPANQFSQRSASVPMQPQYQSHTPVQEPQITRSDDDEDGEKLKREQERLERELLEQREFERKKKERDEAEQQEMDRRRKKFQDDLDQERLLRAKHEEEAEQERKRRAAEQEAMLRDELEKQRKALNEAREVQKKLLDDQISAEQVRLQQERARDEERARVAKEEAEAAALRLKWLREEREAEEKQEERRRVQVALEAEEACARLSMQHATDAGIQENASAVSEPQHPIHIIVDQSELVSETTPVTVKGDRSPDTLESDAHSDAESFHSEHDDQPEEKSYLPEASREEEREHSSDQVIGTIDLPDSTQVESVHSAEYTTEIPEVNSHESGEFIQHAAMEDVMPHVTDKSEEELEEERRKAAEVAKKKEDDDALDVYRQRVLARRAAEKQRQQELEEQRKREEEERAAELARQQAEESEDEMDKSGGSFASSAASSSGSF